MLNNDILKQAIIKGAEKPSYVPDQNLDVFSSVDLDKYNKYIRNINVDKTLDQLNYERASGQSAGEQARNLWKVIPKTALTLTENIGHIAEFAISPIVEDHRDYTNWLVEFSQKGKEYFDEVAPIYRKRPEQTFDWRDSAFYFEHGESLLESIAAFAATGMGVGTLASKGATLVAKNMVKAGLTGANTARTGAALASQGLTATTLAYTEGAVSASDIYKETFEYWKDKIGEEKAKEKASEAAGETAFMNTLLITPLNMTGVAPLFSGMKNLRNGIGHQLKGETQDQFKKRIGSQLSAIQEKGITKTQLGKVVGIESIQEGVEENLNLVAEYLGREKGGLEQYETLFEKITSDEGKLSFMLGAIGGGGQALVMNGMTRKKINEQNKQEYENQISRLKSIADAIDSQERTIKELNKAVEDNDTNKVENIKNKLFYQSLAFHILDGSTDALRGTFESIAKLDNSIPLSKKIQEQIDTLSKQLENVQSEEEKNQITEQIKQLEVEKNKLGDKTEAMLKGFAKNDKDNDYVTIANKKINEIAEFEKKYKQYDDLIYSSSVLEQDRLLNAMVGRYANKKANEDLLQSYNNTKNEILAEIRKQNVFLENDTVFDSHINDLEIEAVQSLIDMYEKEGDIISDEQKRFNQFGTFNEPLARKRLKERIALLKNKVKDLNKTKDLYQQKYSDDKTIPNLKLTFPEDVKKVILQSLSKVNEHALISNTSNLELMELENNEAKRNALIKDDLAITFLNTLEDKDKSSETQQAEEQEILSSIEDDPTLMDDDFIDDPSMQTGDSFNLPDDTIIDQQTENTAQSLIDGIKETEDVEPEYEKGDYKKVLKLAKDTIAGKKVNSPEQLQLLTNYPKLFEKYLNLEKNKQNKKKQQNVPDEIKLDVLEEKHTKNPTETVEQEDVDVNFKKGITSNPAFSLANMFEEDGELKTPSEFFNNIIGKELQVKVVPKSGESEIQLYLDGKLVSYLHEMSWLEKNQRILESKYKNYNHQQQVDSLKKLRQLATEGKLKAIKINSLFAETGLSFDKELQIVDKQFKNKQIKFGIIKSDVIESGERKIKTNNSQEFLFDNLGKVVLLLPQHAHNQVRAITGIRSTIGELNKQDDIFNVIKIFMENDKNNPLTKEILEKTGKDITTSHGLKDFLNPEFNFYFSDSKLEATVIGNTQLSQDKRYLVIDQVKGERIIKVISRTRNLGTITFQDLQKEDVQSSLKTIIENSFSNVKNQNIDKSYYSVQNGKLVKVNYNDYLRNNIKTSVKEFEQDGKFIYYTNPLYNFEPIIDYTENEKVEVKSKRKTKTNNIEAKKADIERRRQEELKGNIVEEVKAYTIDVRGKQYEIYEEKYDKNSSEYFLYVKRDNGDITSVSKDEQKIFNEEGKNKKFLKDNTSEWIDTELQSEINAKYDAELAALEQSKTESTEIKNENIDSDLEDKKTDIERRRQEELDKTSLYEYDRKFKIFQTYGDTVKEAFDNLFEQVKNNPTNKVLRDLFEYINDRLVPEDIHKNSDQNPLVQEYINDNQENIKKASKSPKSAIGKINAKYDAELAALEQLENKETVIVTPIKNKTVINPEFSTGKATKIVNQKNIPYTEYEKAYNALINKEGIEFYNKKDFLKLDRSEKRNALELIKNKCNA